MLHLTFFNLKFIFIFIIIFHRNTKSSDYFVVLDTIRTSISFQKGVAEGWIKVKPHL